MPAQVRPLFLPVATTCWALNWKSRFRKPISSPTENSKLRPITDDSSRRYQPLTNFPRAKDVAGKDRRRPLEE
jgi:hypothetical protein